MLYYAHDFFCQNRPLRGCGTCSCVRVRDDRPCAHGTGRSRDRRVGHAVRHRRGEARGLEGTAPRGLRGVGDEPPSEHRGGLPQRLKRGSGAFARDERPRPAGEPLQRLLAVHREPHQPFLLASEQGQVLVRRVPRPPHLRLRAHRRAGAPGAREPRGGAARPRGRGVHGVQRRRADVLHAPPERRAAGGGAHERVPVRGAPAPGGVAVRGRGGEEARRAEGPRGPLGCASRHDQRVQRRGDGRRGVHPRARPLRGARVARGRDVRGGGRARLVKGRAAAHHVRYRRGARPRAHERAIAQGAAREAARGVRRGGLRHRRPLPDAFALQRALVHRPHVELVVGVQGGAEPAGRLPQADARGRGRGGDGACARGA